MDNSEFLKILPSYMGCKLSGLQPTLNALVYDDYLDGFMYDSKLILRTFDQMTDQEKDRYNEIFANYSFLGHSGSFELHLEAMSAVVNYLRSIGIDCDGILESQFGIKQE